MILIIPYIRFFEISGITLFPFILLKDKNLKQDKRIMNHEKIHIRQQVELLVLPFYLFYLIEFGIEMLKYRNKQKAYMNISFEREAFNHDLDFNYLKNRQLWAWISYIKN
ncbi:MAG: hypothetical protein PHS59_08395 [Paludibacter sp.]|nr:hypothetical protein [Paludibacter sp.]